ncbi:S24 family peptidase [Tritonibacter scottomollicae]|uniref:S24 family peptidase n=1 Tax=Tritonibacter scottomollicae TaxID=483013 RepID=A0ABZ0HJ38_TRISK|nr:S24 family peptidase [Tritonibacter scottomollicae]WOI34159.1 S24 family peptidase [Tritonibacter scottomollicae]
MRPYRDYNPHTSRDNHLLSAKELRDYCLHMPLSFREALNGAMSASGLSMRKLAEKAGVSYEQLKKINQGKTQSTNAEDALRIAAALGISLESFMAGEFEGTPTIAIAGKVGAGASVPVFDAYAKGDGPQVACPPGLSPSGVVAVEVEGDSMEPVYSAGDLLFYSRNGHDSVPSDVIGHRCVCEDEEGMGWVKQVKAGDEPGLFHLISLNPGANNIWNTRLKWAARVRLHWPSDLAKRL